MMSKVNFFIIYFMGVIKIVPFQTKTKLTIMSFTVDTCILKCLHKFQTKQNLYHFLDK